MSTERANCFSNSPKDLTSSLTALASPPAGPPRRHIRLRTGRTVLCPQPTRARGARVELLAAQVGPGRQAAGAGPLATRSGSAAAGWRSRSSRAATGATMPMVHESATTLLLDRPEWETGAATPVRG